MSLQHTRIALQDGALDMGPHLGSGSCGSVYAARWWSPKCEPATKQVAVKVSRTKSLVAEGQNLQKLSVHKLTPEVLSCSWLPTGLHVLVQERCLLLEEALSLIPAQARAPNFWRSLSCLLWRCLLDVHRLGHLVHRDIKPEHWLVNREGRIFLTDLDLAQDLRTVCPRPRGRAETLTLSGCTHDWIGAISCPLRFTTNKDHLTSQFEGTPAFCSHAQLHGLLQNGSQTQDFESCVYVIWYFFRRFHSNAPTIKVTAPGWLLHAWNQVVHSQLAPERCYLRLGEDLVVSDFVRLRKQLQNAFEVFFSPKKSP